MYRYLCRIGPVNLYAYGAMLALAFAAGTWWAVRRARTRGLPGDAVYDLVACILVASLAGARALFVAMNLGYYREHPLAAFKLWEGGLVLYGGIVFGFIAAVFYLKRKKLPVWKMADIIAPPLALGVAIGRIGCFLNGCCYGRISQHWGVCFPAADNPPAYEEQLRRGLIVPGAQCSLPVLPTQLYETSVCVLLAVALVLVERRRKNFDGFLFWLFLALYSVQRFFMEGLRYYDRNFFVGPLTIGQVMSVAFFIAALVVIAVNLRKHERTA